MTTTSRSPDAPNGILRAPRNRAARTVPDPRAPTPPLLDLDDGPTAHILVLQGGGALGAYQWGAYESLAASGRQPDWIAGISIGAINAALIAGNPPERRVERLTEFWHRIALYSPPMPSESIGEPVNEHWLSAASDLAAAWAITFGLPGFFRPRPGAALWPWPMPNPSYYDTTPLIGTLNELVDFDRINDGPMRLSVGAVDVETGNFAYFDSAEQRIGVEHIVASGALPPAFPAVRIDRRWYWDGGLVSNTPLQFVVDRLEGAGRAVILQVDLFSARGPFPDTHADVEERIKDIRFSSRTRAVTDRLAARVALHRRIRDLAARLPEAERADPEVRHLLADTLDPAITLVHLIYRQRGYLTQHKDYEFSARTLEEHRRAGHSDMKRALHRLEALPPQESCCEFRVFDWATP